MKSCEVVGGPMYVWIGVPPPLRRRPPPSRHVPLAHPTAGRDARRVPRSRPVPTPKILRRGLDHGAGAASITADSPTRKGRPARRPAEGRRAGLIKGGWVGLESDTRSKREAGANAVFLLEISVASSGLKGRGPGVGQYSLF